jgi:hypothetical protein
MPLCHRRLHRVNRRRRPRHRSSSPWVRCMCSSKSPRRNTTEDGR